MDGTRDRAAILDELWKLALDKVLVIQTDGKNMTEQQSRARLAEALEQTLNQLARAVILVPDANEVAESAPVAVNERLRMTLCGSTS